MPARFNSRFNQVRAQIQRGTEAAVGRAAIIMQQEIKLQLNRGASPPSSKPGSPPHKLTGALGRSIQVDLSRQRAPIPTVRIGPNLAQVPYARIHEYGGTIRPIFKKFLRWKTKDGKWHMAKSVTLVARPYIKPAVALARPKILAEFHPAKILEAGRRGR